jgi:hypothetical protein
MAGQCMEVLIRLLGAALRKFKINGHLYIIFTLYYKKMRDAISNGTTRMFIHHLPRRRHRRHRPQLSPSWSSCLLHKQPSPSQSEPYL